MRSLTVAEARQRIHTRLAQAGVPTPAVDATWLVRHVTGWSGAQLRIGAGEPLPPAGWQRLQALTRRRAAREPLQLLLGTVAFRHLELEVRPGVFLPRPETEVLAEQAIERTPAGGVVVEPCTGTGAVACAVAAESQAGQVLATDRSTAAVALARANARRGGLAVAVARGDLLAPLDAALRGCVDVLVSNPPYLAEDELEGLEPEVRDWDPYEALVAGPTGHEFSDRLIGEARAWLRPGGWLLLEVADTRAAAGAARAAAAGLHDVHVLADLAGRDRIVAAQAAH